MKIGLVIVGDEILSGRRQDQHLPKVVAMLGQRGLQLSWVKVIGDDMGLLVDTYRQTLATDDIVFSTGGIGATPDDLTRQAVSTASGVPLQRHPEGVELLNKFARERGRTLLDEHYRMVEFPQGASLVPNPANGIPGFSVGQHHFVPGFPEMAWPMIEWLLDHTYKHLHNNQYVERALTVRGKYESELNPILEAIDSGYPGVKLYCLPTMTNDFPVNEVGLKGNLADVKLALEDLKQQLTSTGCDWQNCD